MFPGLALEVRHRKNEISYGKSLLGRPKRDGTMIKKITSYQEDLIEALKDPRDAAAYFNAAIEDGDKEVLLSIRRAARRSRTVFFPIATTYPSPSRSSNEQAIIR